jgi:Leucine-rich repeat (LRR) protein
MRELNLDNCQFLTSISDVSGLPNLEKISFQNCENLVTIHASIGSLSKLKILNAERCHQLMSFPPIKLASLQVLRLQYCKNLKKFPEIPVVMENIEAIFLEGTSIDELSFSFQNLTGLCTLRIQGSGMLTLPSSILLLPNLCWIMVEDCILMQKQNDKPVSKVSSNLRNLILQNCNISDAFLSIIITWFPNLEYLDLSRNNFTMLPQCIEECHFLNSIVLDSCKFLKEIKGIPPNLKTLSALQCESLTSSTRSILLNKVLLFFLE